MNKEIRVALDCDGVVANFVQHFITKANEIGLGEHFPKSWKEIDKWFFSEKIPEVFELIKEDHSFWLSIPRLCNPRKINFTPVAYVTARPIPSEITKQWLDNHGFPDAPVYTVNNPEDKIHILKDLKVDLFIDDKVETVEELNAAGIPTFLFNQPHNRNNTSEHKRIDCLSEI